MSYILDALRKADAERERGNVPSIHAQPMSPGPGAAGAPHASRSPIGVIVAAVLLVIVGAAAAWWVLSARMRDNVPALPVTPAPVATAPAAAVPAAVVASSAAMPPVMTASAVTAPAVTAAPALRATPAPVAAAPRRTTKPAAIAPAASPAPSLSPAPTTTGTTPPARTEPANPNGPLAGKVYALNELPDDIRRQLPTVNIGGSMYSPVRENRLLIVNGQVLHEGDKITPELVVDQVRVKAAVLAFRGYRYLLPF